MKRVVRLAVLLVVLALAAALPASASPEPISRVVIVLAPYLTWQDVLSSDAPTLRMLATQGAIGNINVSSRNRAALVPGNAEQGALTFSAGAWAALDEITPSAYSVNEQYNAGTAAEAFTRLTGVAPSGADIVFLGMPRVARIAAASQTLDVRPGTLGGEIVGAGGVTAAIGNGDPGRDPRASRHSRPAAIVAMDYDGTVRYGDVSAALLKDDGREPFGVTTDVDAVARALEGVNAKIAAVNGPALVVIDPGDLTRAAAVEGLATPGEAAREHAAAVSTLDQVTARALKTLPGDGLLLVLPPVTGETSGTIAGLGPAIAYRRGMGGYLSSSSTQRTGLVTNLDVAATVLDELGIERPVQILGNPMISEPTPLSLEERVQRLVDTNRTAVAVDAAKPGVLNFLIAVTLVVLVLATFVLLRSHLWPALAAVRAASAFRIALLAVLSVPPATLLMFAFMQPLSRAAAVAALLTCTVLVFVLALGVRMTRVSRAPIAVLALLEALLVLVDQWLGAPWSFTGFLGYSPIMAARYYGVGNEGAALLFGATIVGLAFVFDERPDSRFTAFARAWGVPLLTLVVVGTCAAPFLGANVGVVAWGIIGFAVAWALMNGHRITWKVALAMLLAVVLVVGAFSAIDLARSGSSETHLGRAWQSAEQGGVSQLWLIVVRKAQTNLRVLTHTNWSFVLIGMLVFLAFMRWRPQGDFADTLRVNPHFAAAISAGLVGGLVAYFTEDSGIVIPALIMLYVGVGILDRMLARVIALRSAEELSSEPGVSAR